MMILLRRARPICIFMLSSLVSATTWFDTMNDR